MKVFDSHIHLFSANIIRNVQRKPAMVKRLKLQTAGAKNRSSAHHLAECLLAANVEGALLLPTARAAGVQRVNRECIATASGTAFLKTAGTLHPYFSGVVRELDYLQDHHVRIIKLCSFSQGFVLNGPDALKMFEAIESVNKDSGHPLAVILDTLYAAHRFFGTNPEFNTSPQLLAELADRYPGIDFIGAHMGGLDAPYDDIRTHLTPRPNLFLDTSNAAHTLTRKQFCNLAAAHGSRHILFGTDWPWFPHAAEIALIDDLLDAAGFSKKEKSDVFFANIAALTRIR